MHFNVMSWIRLVYCLLNKPVTLIFIYLVHSRAGLQSKLGNHNSTEDNLEILNLEDLIQFVCGIQHDLEDLEEKNHKCT